MKAFRYLLIIGVIVFGFVYVNAGKTKNFQYRAPANFIAEDNYFPSYYPTVFHHTGPEKISIIIPVAAKSKLGVPKTQKGELHPEFLEGKRRFNSQFGIEDWKLGSYKFSKTGYGERLEVMGSYTNFSGVKTEFIEHHYFGKSSIQSIQMYYPEASEGKVVEQAKASLQTFSPNFN